MKLTFTQKEFDTFRKFQDRLAKEFGESVYAGTNNACVLVEYSPQLVEMLRPLPHVGQFEYELNQLVCEDCKKKAMYLCVPGEANYVCDDCQLKRRNKGVKNENK